MTREIALKRLKELVELDAQDNHYPSLEKGDPEDWHQEADAILCTLLEELGYNDIVQLYKTLTKWYA